MTDDTDDANTDDPDADADADADAGARDAAADANADADAGDDLEAIKRRKAEALQRQAGSPDEPIHVESADHFEELVGEHSPLLVDFHADWCGPCQMLDPIVETLAEETPAAVAKVDVDDHQGLAGRHQVQGVPTVLLFVDGELAERTVGAQDEGTLRSLIEHHA